MPVVPCETCGFENPDGFRWCGQCGRQLAASEQPLERRQLTALFCDIVGSTALVTRLDLEEARALFAAFHTHVSRAVERQGGTVSRFLGDGALAYFGWPRAIEGSAVAAVEAALAIQARSFAGSALPETVRVRIGIHTGLAVAGTSATAEVSGPLLHITARLQEIAPGGGVVMSGDTERLVRGRFVTDDLGFVALKGLAEPQRVYRVTAATGVRHTLDARAGFPLTPLVGRAAAMEQLLEHWRRVRNGGTGMILIRGEPGVGKSRLVRAFRAEVAEMPHRWLETAAVETGRNVAFEPLIELGRHLFGYDAEGTLPESRSNHGEKVRSISSMVDPNGGPFASSPGSKGFRKNTPASKPPSARQAAAASA